MEARARETPWLHRQDELAAAWGVAGGGRMGEPASRAAGTASGRERLELVTGRSRHRQRASQKRGAANSPNPTDRGKPGTNRHLILDAHGISLGLTMKGANCHDSRPQAANLDAVPGLRIGRRGRPRRRPDKLHAGEETFYYLN